MTKMVDFQRDKKVLLAIFVVVGMVLYVGYRTAQIGTEIDLTEGSINFSIQQSGMVNAEDVLVYARTDSNGNTYQEHELLSGARLRPIDLTEHTESIKNDAQISYRVIYEFDKDPLTNEALYLKTGVDSSEITIEEVSIFTVRKSFIRKYEHEPAKEASYSVFLYQTDLEGYMEGGLYLQYRGFVMKGLNRESVILSVYIQLIEGS